MGNRKPSHWNALAALAFIRFGDATDYLNWLSGRVIVGADPLDVELAESTYRYSEHRSLPVARCAPNDAWKELRNGLLNGSIVARDPVSSAYLAKVRIGDADLYVEIKSLRSAFPEDSSTPPEESTPSASHKGRRGRGRKYPRPVFIEILNDLFDEHGSLSYDDHEWNSQNQVCDALVERFENKYPKEPSPKETWLKKFVKSYLKDHPQLDSRE